MHLRHIEFVVEFVPLTGSVSAAIVLSYLHGWFKEEPTRLRVYREGKLWLVRNHREWTTDTGLSRKNLRTAANRLQRLGLIEMKVWKFDADPTMHYHLNRANLAIRLAQSGQSITVKTVVPELPIKTQLLSDDFSSSQKDEVPVTTEKTMGKQTAKEVFEEMQKKISASPSKPTKSNAKALSTYWMKLVPKYFDQGMQRPHTMRELGMFAQYAKLTGENAVPAMEWAISHWTEFRYRAKETLGEETPVAPKVGSLLKCCVAAVEGYQKATAKVDFSAVVHSSAQVVTKMKDKQATDAEIEAMLKSVDNHEK